jgi:hypothetical protein
LKNYLFKKQIFFSIFRLLGEVVCCSAKNTDKLNSRELRGKDNFVIVFVVVVDVVEYFATLHV